MKKLKPILQSNTFILIIILLVLFRIFIFKSTNILNVNNKNFEGILQYYRIDDNKLTMQIKNREKILAVYYIKNDKESEYLKNNLVLGSKIKVYGNFIRPKSNTIPNNFNYKKYLKSKNIYLIMNTTKYELSKKTNIFYSFKNLLINVIDKKNAKEYYYTFILGNKDYLDDEIYNLYKINGITHLFAISGMHISVIIYLLKKIKLDNKIISLFLYFYSFLVMFTPSVMRVTIFYTLRNLEKFNDYSNEKLLIITASILIFFNSNIIYDVGFLYSFVITFGLFKIKPKGLIDLSFYAFLLSLPITLYNNFEFNILTILINIIIVPLVSMVIFPLILISMLLSFLDPLVIILIKLLETVNLFFSNNSLNIIIGKPNIIEIIIFYIILYLFLELKKNYLVIILFLVILIIKISFLFDTNYYVYYLDVGQGDSMILIYPRQKETIMIDTGGKVSFLNDKKSYNYSKNTILLLKSLGISKINTLILSHGDYDHMGEAINLVENFKVEKVIFNCGSYNNLEKELIKVLNKKKIKYYSCIKELNIDENKLYFLQTREYDNENDNSNVIYTELNGHKFMFMGDASINTEKEIINKYNLPYIDVLKVGHHGSKTSSSEEFINKINPNYSVISVGKNNRYGHPNKEVLNNLNNSKIYRTDQDGSVLFKIKNNELKVETCEQ